MVELSRAGSLTTHRATTPNNPHRTPSLAGNALADEGTRTLAAALKNNTTVTVLECAGESVMWDDNR